MRVFFVVIALFVFKCNYSQNFQSVWSEGASKEKEEKLEDIIPTIDSGYVVIRRLENSPNSISVTVLDSNLTLQFDKSHSLPADEIIAVDRVGEKITFFASKYNSATKEDELYVYRLNNEGELTSTSLLFKSPANGGYHSNYRVSVSPDKNKVGIICERAYMEEKSEFMDVLYLDKDVQITNSIEHGYSFPSLKRRVNFPVINNDGVLYVGKRMSVKGANNYYLSVIEPSRKEEHEIKLRSRKIADINFGLTEDGELIASGFYSSYGILNFEGVFTMKFKASVNASYSKEVMLPENSIVEFKSKKEISKSGYGLDKFHIKRIIVNKDGSSYLITEHLDLEKEDGSIIDNRDGALVVKFSAAGDFLWSAPIKMDQEDKSHNGYWSSAVFYGNKDKMGVIYNLIGDVDKKVMSEFGTNMETGSMVCEIDLNGNVSTTLAADIFSKLNEKVSLRTQCHTHYGEEIIVVAENTTRDKFYVGKITEW